MGYFARQQTDLASLAAMDRSRRLTPRSGRDFSSNDYLGLAGAPRLAAAVAAALERGVPIGSGGSRLLRGNHAEHQALEEEAARFFGSETALFFSSGYAANVALLATLPQRGDLVVYDALVHASAHEGLRLGRAENRAAAHNEADAFEAVIAAWRREGGTGRVWIAVESLYSMDGDRAPLDALAALADRHEAILLVDEAHATGVFGADGRGLADALQGRENLITLHTCGKALGCEGALLCAPATVRDFLVNRGRGFIFSTAPSPLIAAAVRAALRLLVEEPQRRERLHALIGAAQTLLAPTGVTPTGSQILPLIIGDDGRTMARAATLRAAGFDVRGIRPPTVPAGTARLRVSLTLNIGLDDVAALAGALA
ncbi:8-amino-7-oxononanoate synthase [Sphingomonas naasensis]|uniref:8-amino-7-oxononanoate synthase n=1 Tax=Sphingomonas naasensis TaxID=1344951 RepID=A0A4V3QWP1_9SPHN|nr:8-amino-7-oxononanoate synthase [Sphingomonas naasensis]NIJ21002.1 8-amino-7-oxononanoate synthase [Sphingomonas naasensis]TGX43382.1 8-amino-7-oxononanoate synthase [Sphingomonas naasensis]